MRFLALLTILSLIGCSANTQVQKTVLTTVQGEPELTTESSEQLATFAGGCFWCTEKAFEGREGVLEVISGFAGGNEADPSYEQVAGGETSYREAVQVTYDPSVISYETLLDILWKSINPTDNDGQYADRGFQYTTAIFYHNEAQKTKAEQSKANLAGLNLYDDPIITPVIPYTTFYPAEEYHQDYYKKNPMRYQLYYKGSGRPAYLESVWGDSYLH